MIAISTARADITPTAMSEMGGYATLTGPRLATGTYSPLMARVLILWWDDEPHAIVTLDAGTLPPAWHQALRPRLVALADWASADITILCTHTHNAPMTLSHPDPWITYAATDLTACEAYWSDLADTVVQLVAEALADWKTPVTLDYKTITQNFSALRESNGYTWATVPILVARDFTGRPRAVLTGYGTHAVAAGEQTEWDGDYPAAACAVIEAAVPGCHAQFTIGPAGDQDPIGNPRGWAMRNRLGAQLGAAVVAALDPPGRPLVGPITTSLTSVSVPLQVPANATERAARLATYTMRGANPGGVYPQYYVRHSGVAIAAINAGTDPHVVDIPIQVWRLGIPMLRIAFVGGEPVSGFGVWAQAHYGGPAGIMFVGYANAVPCYVVGNPQLPPPLGLDGNGSYGGAQNTDDRQCVGESGCVYGMCWHFMPGLGPGSAEKTIIDALTAALA